MNCTAEMLRLYAVTDRAWVGKLTLPQQVEAALKGGATCVQLREKNLADSSILAEAREISALCKQYRVPFILNDNVALAAQCGADGVHLGQEDMDPAEARRILGPDAIIGVSAHNVAEAKAAVAAGADYLGCGAMFATTTKTNVTALPKETLRAICAAVSAHSVEEALAAQAAGADYLGVGAAFVTGTKTDAKPISRETIRAITAAVDIPVVAIGGISKQNLLSLAHCGEAGVALVSAIFAAEDIEKECRELRRLAEML